MTRGYDPVPSIHRHHRTHATMKYSTTAAYISGAICGRTWYGPMGGKLHRANVRDITGRFSDRTGSTFRDMLLSDLMRNGGDFQSAHYAAGTVLRVERRTPCVRGTYQVHVYERELSKVPGCADLIDPDHFVMDLCGDED